MHQAHHFILLLHFVTSINFVQPEQIPAQCNHKNYRIIGAAKTNLRKEKYYIFLETGNGIGDRFTTFEGVYFS